VLESRPATSRGRGKSTCRDGTGRHVACSANCAAATFKGNTNAFRLL